MWLYRNTGLDAARRWEFQRVILMNERKCVLSSGNITHNSLSDAEQSTSIRDSFVLLDMRLAARILTRYTATAIACFFPFPWCRSHRSFLDYFLENQFARQDCFLANLVLHFFVPSTSHSSYFLVGGSGRASGTDFSPAPFVNLLDLRYPGVNL